MASIAPPSSSVAALTRQPVQFLKWCGVSKETKGSVCSFVTTNSNITKLKSVSLRVASSFKSDGGGYPAGGVSGNGDTLLPKSTSVRGQDHPVADPVLPMDSMITPEILSTNLARVVEKFSDDDTDTELDLDSPTEGFASIADAIEDIRQGKLVIVVDDESRENEGDMIMAASLVTPEAMAFIVRHGTGIVCVSMKEDDLERLNLPLMVTTKENEEKLCTAFTVTVDAKEGTTTGVSAKDRAKTIMTLASPDSKPEDFNRPGHIFPLKYREGGVLKRAGHTEASVDLAMLAGLPPVAVLCEIVDDADGSMARLPKLRVFAERENLKIVSIADLIRYRRKRDRLIERASVARLPLKWGNVRAYCYRSVIDGIEHIAMVKGDIGDRAGLEPMQERQPPGAQDARGPKKILHIGDGKSRCAASEVRSFVRQGRPRAYDCTLCPPGARCDPDHDRTKPPATFPSARCEVRSRSRSNEAARCEAGAPPDLLQS